MIRFRTAPTMNAPATPSTGAPKGRSCLLYGCLTLIVVMLAIGVAGFFAGRHLMDRFATFLEEYTDAAPMAIPTVQTEPGEFEALQERMGAFQQALEQGTADSPLVLSGHDLNVLLARHPDIAAWRDRAYLQVVGDQIVGQISLPLDELARLPGMKRLRGRYLNGVAALRPSLRNDQLSVHLESLEVKGQPIPEEIMRSLRQQNLAQDAQFDRDMTETLARLQSIEVTEGQIVIRPAPSP
jgi:hypothetical protein